MLNLGKVASPATAATVLVPDKVPVPGFVPIATVMFPVNPVAVLPLPSWAVIWTAGEIAAPATVFVGSTMKTSALAAAGVMLNAVLVVLPALAAVILNPALVVLPAPFLFIFLNDPASTEIYTLSLHAALPISTVLVPDKVPVPGFVPIATVIFPVNPVAVLPLPSWAVTSTAGVIAAPAVVVVGWTLKTNCAARPAEGMNAELGGRPAPVDVRV